MDIKDHLPTGEGAEAPDETILADCIEAAWAKNDQWGSASLAEFICQTWSALQPTPTPTPPVQKGEGE